MLKIGIIGLGDIARKAYLPVITSRHIELHLFSRNQEVVRDIADKYRLKNTYDSLNALIDSGIKGAFVHTSTHSHYEIVEQLLMRGVHVYVDKPITDQYDSCSVLIDLATKNNLILQAGFNRRFAPAYASLKHIKNASMIILQKNRKSLPGEVRTFVFDDFIHVIDTLLYLFPKKEKQVIIHGYKKNGLLHHVMIQFLAPTGEIAIGIMNRDSGTIEERLEMFTPECKWIVDNVADSYVHKDKNITRLAVDDWQATLSKRGFEQIIDDFIDAVATGRKISDTDLTLESHLLCEQVVNQIQNS